MLSKLRWTRNGFKTLFNETKNEKMNMTRIIEGINNSTIEELAIFTNLVIPYNHQQKIPETWTKDISENTNMNHFNLNFAQVKMLCLKYIDLRLDGKI